MGFVFDIFHEHKSRYGARRITIELKRIGIEKNYKHIQSIMRELGLQAKGTTRRYRCNKPVLDPGANLLNREFDHKTKNRAWVGDITYVPTKEGFLYLAIMLDLHSRKVVGWSMGKRINENLTVDAFRQAYDRERPSEGLLLHTDRGSQYTSKAFNRELEQKSCIHSYSRKGNPYDNAVMESFYRTLKRELLDKKDKFPDRITARQEIFKYIELYYNTKRAHSSLGYMSPVDYERKNAHKINS